jgi:hypothetical protein
MSVELHGFPAWTPIQPCANLPAFRVRRRFAPVTPASDDEWAFEVDLPRDAVRPQIAVTVLAQLVDAQAVLILVDTLYQPMLELNKLPLTEAALEHRLLHPLPVRQADQRDLPQPPASSGGFRRYVVGHEDVQAILPSSR